MTTNLDEAVGYQLLVLCADFRVRHESHDGCVINEDIAIVSSAGDGLTNTFGHDFHREILGPARIAKTVPTFQARHHRRRKGG